MSPFRSMGQGLSSTQRLSSISKNEDTGNYRPVSLTSILGKVMEHLIMKVISKYVVGKKVIRSSHHILTKGKSFLTDQIAYYDEMISWVDEGRVVNVA